MPRDLVLRGVSGEVLIGDGHKTFIIAEIGQNHQGDLLLAKKLVLAAKVCYFLLFFMIFFLFLMFTCGNIVGSRR